MSGSRWRMALAHVSPPKIDLPSIERFRGVVLLPPEDDTLFDELRLVEAYCTFGIDEYVIHLVPPEGVDPTGFALLAGEVHDRMCLSRQRPGTHYTQWRGPMPDGAPPGTLLKEAFRGLRVGVAPSLVQHSFSPNSHYEEWFVAWYDEAQNLTYTISLQRWVARRFGAAGILSEENAATPQSSRRWPAAFPPLTGKPRAFPCNSRTLTTRNGAVSHLGPTRRFGLAARPTDANGSKMQESLPYAKLFNFPNAMIGDPFCGSGTTPLVAARLWRRCLTSDISPVAVRLARARVAAVA